MPISSGIYIITNVKQGNLVFLENPDDKTPLRGHYRKNIPSERWRITRLENGYHLIWNVEYERYANCGSRAGLDAYVEGHDMEQQWHLQEHSTGKYTIATTDNGSLWMLPDSELFTPVGLSKVSTDRTCWWTFTDPETEAPLNNNDTIQAVIFEMKQLPIPPFSPLILDLFIIQEMTDDSISTASAAVSEIYYPLVSSGRVQPDAVRINITEFKAFGSSNISFQRFSDFVTFERLRNVQWLRCGGLRWVESGISGFRADATKVAILKFNAIPPPHIIMELITRLVKLDTTLVLTLIQPDLEDALYNSDIFRELGKLASGSMHYLHGDGFSDYILNYNETVALPRLTQDAELLSATIRHLIEVLTDTSHDRRSAAGTVLSKLAAHAELRVSIISPLLKIVEMLKDNNAGAEFAASALVQLAEHLDVRKAVCLAIPRIMEILKDKNHGKRSAAVTVLSTFAEQAELRDSIFAGALKIIEMVKDNGYGAEFAASAIVKLAEHSKLSKIRAIYRDNSSRTSLSWAAENGLDGVIRLLLARMDIDVNARDNYGWTPLLWAVREGHGKVVHLLLDHPGVDINTKNNRGETPLWLAACKKHDAIIRRLLDHPSVDVNSEDDCGQTPLSWAAQEGSEGIVSLLLNHEGVNVNAKDKQGHTPLWLAACKKRHAATRLLLAHPCVDVNATDRHSQTPLLWAAREGHAGTIRLLLDCHGITIDTKDDGGCTPLLWAAREGHDEVVRLLLDYQGVEVNAKNNRGETPLWLAACRRHDAVIRRLLAHPDVDVNAKDDHGQTPLSWVAQEGHHGVVEILLTHRGIDIDAKDNQGRTPLRLAGKNGHKPVVGLLREKVRQTKSGSGSRLLTRLGQAG